ncbi:UPF0481 protein At3g47200-like [Prunus avium]|uniref:UPF0481 protein At3g47200-like n=1 Tax=Prunus avium TaxID=42229 RepID=A0A6P5R704_PRUAV|nr:UPF0481 protein At3g47200-like [Prunus avium]
MAGSNQADQNDIENPYISLANSMRKGFNSLSPPSSECCIYRVPQQLRSVNEKLCTPQAVSIGPLHHGKEGLNVVLEEHKQRYLQDFIGRTNVSLEDFIKKIKDHEARLRRCHGEPIKFSSDEFVTIILVDAAFVIELLLKYYFKFQDENDLWENNDRIFNKPRMLLDLLPDLQLLENQLPFFILEDLNKITVSCNSSELSMIKLSYKFLKKALDLEGAEDSLQKISSCSCNPKVEHFLDFIRTLHLTKLEETDQSNEGRSKNFMTTHCITKLHQAGVKFKLASSRNLFDIKFDDGILVIPKLKISDHTELTLRNLIAFEQCHCQNNYISDYVSLMDNFVNTEKDVEYLLKDGIVEHMLGDDNKVCTLINNLGRGVVLHREGYHFATLSESLNSYCREPWHKWKANLRQNYFNTPWATISVIAAVLLLILTCVQAVCSIISVIPSKNQKY